MINMYKLMGKHIFALHYRHLFFGFWLGVSGLFTCLDELISFFSLNLVLFYRAVIGKIKLLKLSE